MRYIYTRIMKGDATEQCFESNDRAEAIAYGRADWEHLTDRERAKAEYAMVIESANPDEDAPDHYDGNPVADFKGE